jgi:hypothetical protein
MNVGIQRELRPGMVLSADYLRNVQTHYLLGYGENPTGDIRYLNKAAAVQAISATNQSFNCGTGTDFSSIQCAISAGAQMTDYAARPLQRIRSRRSHHRRRAAAAPRDPAHSSPCPIGLVLDQPEPKPPPPQTAGVPILANVGLPTTGRPPRDFSNCCLKIFCVIPQKMTRVSRIAKPNPITSDVAMLRQFRFPIPSSRVSFNPKYEGREIGVQSNRFRAKRRSRNCLSI